MNFLSHLELITMRTIVLIFVVSLCHVQAGNYTALKSVRMCKDHWDCKQCMKVKREGKCTGAGFFSGVCYKTCSGCGPYEDKHSNCASIAKQGKCFVRKKVSPFTTPAVNCEKSCCTGIIRLPTPSRPFWDEWSYWGVCSKTCNSGFRKRTRSCNGATSVIYCKGYSTEFQVCNRGITCRRVNGGWSKWSDWSSCQSSCGEGKKLRTRQCSNPWPQNGGQPCRGVNQQAKRCYSGCCPGNGSWGKWSPWGACKCSFRSGERERTRVCDSPRPHCGGKACQGAWRQTKGCSSLCPSEPGAPVWSSWSKWSPCSQTCQYGYRSRTRKCIRNSQPYRYCQGHAKEYDWCNDNIRCS